LSVLDSDAKFSVQIKEEVARQLETGKSKAEILQFFEERYGPWILREPPKEGFNAVVWAFPIALLILGPLCVWYFVWRKTQHVSSGGIRDIPSIVKEMELELSGLRRRT
jgi:cytochrome c-type biogenesis protein CcmH